MEKAVSSILKKYKEKTDKELRTDRELIEEILSLTRLSSRRSMTIEADNDFFPVATDLEHLYSSVLEAYEMEDYHEVKKLLDEMKNPINYFRRRAATCPVSVPVPTME